MNTTYAVVSGNLGRGFTLYGPFTSVEAAHEWSNHPHRAEETRAEYRVLPLFGGIGITDEQPYEPADDDQERAHDRAEDVYEFMAADADRRERTWTGVARP